MDIKRTRILDLNATDLLILKIVQEHGNISLRQIQKIIREMQLKNPTDIPSIPAISTINKTLERLTNESIIKHYAAILDCSKIGYREMILFFIKPDFKRSLQSILHDLSQLEEINIVCQISGDYSIFAIAKCIEKADQITLLESIKHIEGIENITTQIVMQKTKEDMRVKIPDFSSLTKYQE